MSAKYYVLDVLEVLLAMQTRGYCTTYALVFVTVHEYTVCICFYIFMFSIVMFRLTHTTLSPSVVFVNALVTQVLMAEFCLTATMPANYKCVLQHTL